MNSSFHLTLPLQGSPALGKHWADTAAEQRDGLGSVSPSSKSFALSVFLRGYYLACYWMEEGMKSCKDVRFGVNFVLTP